MVFVVHSETIRKLWATLREKVHETCLIIIHDTACIYLCHMDWNQTGDIWIREKKNAQQLNDSYPSV